MRICCPNCSEEKDYTHSGNYKCNKYHALFIIYDDSKVELIKKGKPGIYTYFSFIMNSLFIILSLFYFFDSASNPRRLLIVGLFLLLFPIAIGIREFRSIKDDYCYDYIYFQYYLLFNKRFKELDLFSQIVCMYVIASQFTGAIFLILHFLRNFT